ncbi:hypothetical protein QTO34_003346 [Cnephaeus nilssonii]|uniref:Uncharacterized protein n=1 Tax=Cnephaeus nilssonii TaxID=3371016 RepID=A0AA40HRD3_CNENI|nr:hypothetical protein QTO34_003346 [Eptesicus nilssonii]
MVQEAPAPIRLSVGPQRAEGPGPSAAAPGRGAGASVLSGAALPSGRTALCTPRGCPRALPVPWPPGPPAAPAPAAPAPGPHTAGYPCSLHQVHWPHMLHPPAPPACEVRRPLPAFPEAPRGRQLRLLRGAVGLLPARGRREPPVVPSGAPGSGGLGGTPPGALCGGGPAPHQLPHSHPPAPGLKTAAAAGGRPGGRSAPGPADG